MEIYFMMNDDQYLMDLFNKKFRNYDKTSD